MKIVILDGYAANPGDLSWEGIAAQGDLTVYDYTPNNAPALIERIGDAEAIFVNKEVITAEIMDACPTVKFIGVLATGYNVVDTAAAKERGIVVCNIPAYSTPSVAQFTIALLLELACHVGHHDGAVKEGRWCTNRDFCFWDMPIMELEGKTMGIIGFGNIGRAVGRIARALGMKVIAAGSRPCAEGEAIGEYVDFDTLFAQSDVISLHCPLFPSTKGIICAENIAKMKDGVLIVNTARGPLIEQDDLCAALASGKVGGAAVDVVDVEPMLAGNPLLNAPNCVITPHIAWASKEARGRLVDIAVENLRCFIAGEPQNVVNL